MKKLALFIAAGSVAMSFSAVTFAVEAEDSPEISAADTVVAACERYPQQLRARCLARATEIVRRYPQIMENVQNARQQSSSNTSIQSEPSSINRRAAQRLTAAERRAQRMEKRMMR